MDETRSTGATILASPITNVYESTDRHPWRDIGPGGIRSPVELLVTKGHGPSLLGRDWLAELRLDWREVRVIQASSQRLKALLDRHANVFRDELGTLRGVKAKIHIEPGAQPRYYRPRNVPYAMRERVNDAIDQLERDGVIEAVRHSDWAAPIVPIVKSDGSIRLCGDYKVTVNKVAKPDTFLLPRIEDIFASLEGGKRFSKIDLAHAYTYRYSWKKNRRSW